MDFGIQGRYGLVCAASKGLGKAIAMSLAQEGVQLFLCARNAETLAAAAEEIRAVSPHPVKTMACDLSDAEDRERLIAAVKEAFGSLDILIHNVGGPPPSMAETTPLAAWERGFHQLFMSIVHLNQAFLPGMKEKRWGRIVNVTSLSVMEPVAGLAVSNGMRPAIAAMSKTLADEVAGYNITVNSVAPGIIHTARTEERIEAAIAQKGGTREAHLAEYVKSVPAGRLGTPEEFAAAVCFLCSQPASYITGSTLCVDGGKRRSAY
jgi:3-oxoacyl-[acyl-carrier protein] reductase